MTARHCATRSKAPPAPAAHLSSGAPFLRVDLAAEPGNPDAGSVAEAIVAERRRLARELHDGPIQSLWFLGAEIRRLQARAAEAPDEVSAGLQALQATWAHVYDELRQATGDLHQLLPADNALVLALERSLASLERQMPIAAELSTKIEADPYPLDRATEAQLVRICQTTLANVRRHSEARHVRVEVRVDSAGAHISIEDDGVGFDPTRLGERPMDRYGLAMMRERAELLGGQVELSSAPGQGTRLRVWVPARQAAAGGA